MADFIDNILQAKIIAIAENRGDDEAYIRELFYKFYEEDLCLKNTETK